MLRQFGLDKDKEDKKEVISNKSHVISSKYDTCIFKFNTYLHS